MRIKTNYPGVYYREVSRLGKNGLERVYYIVFKKNGKMIEEKVGRQYSDNMTPAKAALIRGERIEGKRISRKALQKVKEAIRTAEQNKWTFEKLWCEYKKRKLNNKGMIQDENRYNKYLKPSFGSVRGHPKCTTQGQLKVYHS